MVSRTQARKISRRWWGAIRLVYEWFTLHLLSSFARVAIMYPSPEESRNRMKPCRKRASRVPYLRDDGLFVWMFVFPSHQRLVRPSPPIVVGTCSQTNTFPIFSSSKSNLPFLLWWPWKYSTKSKTIPLDVPPATLQFDSLHLAGF